MIGTWIGLAGGKDKSAAEHGLFGFNSVLTGLALSLYFEDIQKWAIAIIGAAVSALATAAVMHIMRNWGIPVLTFPYIILTWFLLLASFHLELFELSPTLIPQDITHLKQYPETKINLVDGLVDGIGQVYFMESLWSGIVILIAFFGRAGG